MRAIILIALIFLALFGLFAPQIPCPAAIIIGGEYTVQAGETRSGDMLLIFTRVKVVDGGLVDGNLQVFGSLLEVSGSVNGDIQAYGSDVSIDTPLAQIAGVVNTLGSLRGLPKFPSLLLVIS